MADAITIKALQDASLDAKSLEEVVNGDEAKQVTTRKGETYPSVKKAIKAMFQNGGVPATPFATKALMIASALVDGDIGVVINDTDTDLNGYYIKSGTWKYSELNYLYRGVGTMQYFHGKINWVSTGSVRIGKGYNQNANQVADVSQMSSAKLRLKRLTSKDLGFFNIRVFFHTTRSEVVSGAGTEQSSVTEKNFKFMWNSKDDIEIDIDVSEYSGLLVSISLTSSADSEAVIGETMFASLVGVADSHLPQTKIVSSGSHPARNADFLIGMGTEYESASPVDIKGYSAIHLNLKGLAVSSAPIFVEVFLFDKPTGAITGNYGSIIPRAQKRMSFQWDANKGLDLSEYIDVVGFSYALVAIRLAGVSGVATTLFYHKLTCVRDFLKYQLDNNHITASKNETVEYTYKASELYGLDLSPTLVVRDHLAGRNIKNVKIFIKRTLPNAVTLQLFDLLDGSTPARMNKWNGVEFTQIEGSQELIIPGNSGFTDYFDVTDIFNYGSEKGYQMRLKPTKPLEKDSDKYNADGITERSLTIIYKGVK